MIDEKIKMIEGFSKDNIILCTKFSAEIKDLSDEAWISGAVYCPSYGRPKASGNTSIYTDGITIGKEYRVTEKTIIVNDSDYHDTISIINDYGSERYYLSELFISKSEMRNNKLDILFDEQKSSERF